MSNILSARGIAKEYPMGLEKLKVLRGIDLDIKTGEAVAITGASGAGKSTLLHILGTLDRPSAGKVLFDGKDVLSFGDDAVASFRNRELGFVFQFHHLLKEFTALENVMMPCRIAGLSDRESRDRAQEALKDVGLVERAKHFPGELSGGEQQRVAVARALVRRPRLLLADEPTGNLDTANGRKIQDMFFRLKQQRELTLVVVTHDRAFAERFPRILTMQDGAMRSPPNAQLHS